MIMMFPFHHLYPLRPVKRYTCQALLYKWDVWPYLFKPVLPPITDRDTDDGIHHIAVSESPLVDRAENTDWKVCL